MTKFLFAGSIFTILRQHNALHVVRINKPLVVTLVLNEKKFLAKIDLKSDFRGSYYILILWHLYVKQRYPILEHLKFRAQLPILLKFLQVAYEYVKKYKQVLKYQAKYIKIQPLKKLNLFVSWNLMFSSQNIIKLIYLETLYQLEPCNRKRIFKVSDMSLVNIDLRNSSTRFFI